MKIFKRLFCKHEYKPIQRTTYQVYRIIDGYTQEIYLTYRCEKCGRTKTKLIDTKYPNINFDGDEDK